MVSRISFHEQLINLEKASNQLKSKLLHDKLKYDNYSYRDLEKDILLILNEYKIHKSIARSASNLGISRTVAVRWYIEGQRGNPNFKLLSSGIQNINNRGNRTDYEIVGKEYEIVNSNGSWIYNALVDGEKISVISSDLDHLKERIMEKNLPL